MINITITFWSIVSFFAGWYSYKLYSHQKVTRGDELNSAKSGSSSDDRCQETPGSNFAGDELGKGNDIHAISIPDTNIKNKLGRTYAI